MWKRRRRRTRDEAPESDPLADECEAFLAGRYPHHLFASGAAIPPWAWLNPLAHAQPGALVAIARHQPDPGESIATWSGAIGRLASEILELTGQDRIALRRLQLNLLVPLELRLAAGGDDPDAPTEPEQLLDRVLELLILSS